MNSSRICSFIFYLTMSLAGMSILQGCLKSVEYTDKAVALKFSVDTLHFDTVFTTRGTATRFFTVYNPASKAVKVDIAMGMETPFFNMNVDGIPGDKVEDVEILGKDSIYVFVEAEIDPHNPLSVSPFIVEDFIKFNTNGREQSVRLEAYGQDAIYLTPDNYQGKQVYLSCDMGEVTWENERPFILNGILLIDSCTLNIAPGTRLYVHGGIEKQGEVQYQDGAIIVMNHGKLHINGTEEEPVLIGGDRLEEEFEGVAGQWNGIRFIEASRGNIIRHCTIENAIIGLYVDSLSSVKIEKSKVVNSASYNILASTADIQASNSLFADAGQTSVALSGGGSYNFTYSTIVNYGTGGNALYCSNLYRIDDKNFKYIPIEVSVQNSIISSSISDALSLALKDRDYKNIEVDFSHSGIRSDELTDSEFGYPGFYEYYKTAFRIHNTDTLFLDTDDYMLDTFSIAEGKALPLIEFPDDILGTIRDSSEPDAGCYELVH